MRKNLFVFIGVMILCLMFSACYNSPIVTSTVEPTTKSEIQTITLTSTSLEPVALNTHLPPTMTPTSIAELLPDLQPISNDNVEKIGLLRTSFFPDYSARVASQCSLDFSPDGRLLVGACGGNPMPVWDVQSSILRYQLYKDAPKQIVACDFSPDSRTIACGGVDKIITFWDSETGEKIRQFGKHDSPIWELDFSPDGKTLVSASFADDVRFWDVASGDMLWSFNSEISHFLSVFFNPSGNSIAYGNVWGKVGILDVKTGKSVADLVGPKGAPVGDVAFSPSGKLLAAGSDDKKIYLWNAEDFQPIVTLEGHAGYVNGVGFSPDETLLVSGSHDKTVGIWDVADLQLLKQLEGHESIVLRIAFSPDGKLIASISWDGTVRLWGVGDE